MPFSLPNKHKLRGIHAVFVLTPGRSGSLWLAWAFQQFYYRIISLHEPGAMIKDLAFQYYNNTASLEDATTALRTVKLPAIDAARLYMKKTHYIEVGRNLFSLVQPLRHAVKSRYVSVSFLGLVGDGRVFVRSMANKGAYVQSRPYGWFRPSGHPDWNTYSQIQKLAYHWVEKVKIIKSATDLVYRVEDITTSIDCWNTMVKTIGLPPLKSRQKHAGIGETRVHHTPYKLYRSFTDISQEDQDKFWLIAGDTMKGLGYGV